MPERYQFFKSDTGTGIDVIDCTEQILGTFTVPVLKDVWIKVPDPESEGLAEGIREGPLKTSSAVFSVMSEVIFTKIYLDLGPCWYW